MFKSTSSNLSTKYSCLYKVKQRWFFWKSLGTAFSWNRKQFDKFGNLCCQWKAGKRNLPERGLKGDKSSAYQQSYIVQSQTQYSESFETHFILAKHFNGVQDTAERLCAHKSTSPSIRLRSKLIPREKRRKYTGTEHI